MAAATKQIASHPMNPTMGLVVRRFSFLVVDCMGFAIGCDLFLKFTGRQSVRWGTAQAAAEPCLQRDEYCSLQRPQHNGRYLQQQQQHQWRQINAPH